MITKIGPLTPEQYFEVPLAHHIENFKKCCEEMETLHPEVFRSLYPRMYNGIGEFHSPKMLAQSLLAYGPTLLKETVKDEGNAEPPVECVRTMMWLPDLIVHRVPTYFIRKDFAQAVIQTDLHIEDWTAMHLPFESGVFILERGAMPTPYGDVMFAMWGRTTAEYLNSLHVRYQLQGKLPDAFPEHFKHLGHLGILQDGTTFNGDLYVPLEGGPPGAIHGQLATDEMAEDMLEQDIPIAQKLRLLVYGTLLAMTARPALVTHGQREKVVSHKETRKEYWSPNIVGDKYVIKREGPPGTHASPRMHWRRGHFRNQPVGPREMVLTAEGEIKRRVGIGRKVIWLEPALVAARAEGK